MGWLLTADCHQWEQEGGVKKRKCVKKMGERRGDESLRRQRRNKGHKEVEEEGGGERRDAGDAGDAGETELTLLQDSADYKHKL